MLVVLKVVGGICATAWGSAGGCWRVDAVLGGSEMDGDGVVVLCPYSGGG